MIDLHCHMLPNLDDGARTPDMALAMARLAVADGITMTVCTPHIYPGLFENTAKGISEAAQEFREALSRANIPLKISTGADIQVPPNLLQGLTSGALPTLHNSRYFLFEPPHHTVLPNMLGLVSSAVSAGYVPIITHPERLSYIESCYDDFLRAVEMGAWIQLTGGSLLGRFGPRVKKITKRFLTDGVTHLLASDGHNLKNRTPVLARATKAASKLVGEEEALRLVLDRPRAVIQNLEPAAVPAPKSEWSDSSLTGKFRALWRSS